MKMGISRYIALKLILLLFIISCNSPLVFSQVSFGILAGASLQNLTGTYENGEKLNNDYIPGFHAGIASDIPLTPYFYFQPGLLFSTKGANNVYDVGGQKVTLYYIELPLHIAFKSHAGSSRIIVGIGPYLAYAISGNFQFAGGKEEIIFRNVVTPSEQQSGIPYFRPLDAGADLILEYKFSYGLAVRTSASISLVNIKPKTEGQTSGALLRNAGLGISLGFWF